MYSSSIASSISKTNKGLSTPTSVTLSHLNPTHIELLKQAILSFSSSESIGIKVRDKMYDVYSRVHTIFHEHVLYKKTSIISDTALKDEASAMLDTVSEIVRILIRLFITEHKIHLAFMIEKLFKMFVSLFDSMYVVYY